MLPAAHDALLAAAACPPKEEPAYMAQLMAISPASTFFLIVEILSNSATSGEG